MSDHTMDSQTDIESSEDQVKTLTAEIAKLKNEIDELVAQYSGEHKTKINELKTQNELLKALYSELKTKNDELETKNEQDKQKVNPRKAKYRRKEAGDDSENSEI
ncbi:MAG: hypothetical protein MHMPM18_003273 [Marteilia pararefringens]